MSEGTPVLRVARPSNDLDRLLPFYVDGLGFKVLSRFDDHAGFDGIIVGHPHATWHLEFTRQLGHRYEIVPDTEQLLVLYLPDAAEYERAVARMNAAGFTAVPSNNPYWDAAGATFEDPDKYRVAVANRRWNL